MSCLRRQARTGGRTIAVAVCALLVLGLHERCGAESPERPNILLILADDLGYSDLGCYGGEAQTPNLNGLAAAGLRYTQFYNTAKCCPSRASLLTGLYPHQADVGHMVFDDGIDGYRGELAPDAVTIAQLLRASGYGTAMAGKWHVTGAVDGPDENWPLARGIDDFYGIITGAANYFQPRTLARNNQFVEPEGDDYYLTDRITDEAIRQLGEHVAGTPDRPFFQYVAYTAPHWPLHAPARDIANYRGRFNAGWDQLRRERLDRLIVRGIVPSNCELSPRGEGVPAWEDVEHKAWQARRMEVFAAQIDRMDQGIGRILATLRSLDCWDDTLILFLSDNGGCTEELRDDYIGRRVRAGLSDLGTAKTRDGRDVRYGNVPTNLPGGEETYVSYGVPWANVSNTPFRMYKRWVHEGGISTPLVVYWPRGIAARGELRRQPAQLPDVMATLLDVAGVEYPTSFDGHGVKPLEGFSMRPTFDDEPHARDVLYWEHEGNRAIRRGRWKLVSDFPGEWELYDIEADRTELHDVAADHPEIVHDLGELHAAWAERSNVVPWTRILRSRQQKRAAAAAANK